MFSLSHFRSDVTSKYFFSYFIERETATVAGTLKNFVGERRWEKYRKTEGKKERKERKEIKREQLHRIFIGILLAYSYLIKNNAQNINILIP